jgi:DNA-binding MarR family transcriptional regulator
VPPRENVLRGFATKVNDETAVTLYWRYRSGELQKALAYEIGVHPSALSKRFRRLKAEGLVA